MNTKAQSLSITTVVIVILVLVVLVVLLYFLITQTSFFSRELNKTLAPEVCRPPAQVKPMTECNYALPGKFVRPDGSPLGFTEVCCAD
jgi:flagellar basal body-associated protein FliL